MLDIFNHIEDDSCKVDYDSLDIHDGYAYYSEYYKVHQETLEWNKSMVTKISMLRYTGEYEPGIISKFTDWDKALL